MTGHTVKFRLPRRASASAQSLNGSVPHSLAVHPTARLLALAHFIERAIESGTCNDYATAARAIGMSQAHLAHIMNLLLLAPQLQEAILTGEMTISEHRLRAVLKSVVWDEQASSAT